MTASRALRYGHARPRLNLLNSFELLAGGKPITLPMTAQRLLAFLALHHHPLQRIYVAGMLWMDSPEERAAANLRSSLWRLHQPGHVLVEATGRQLRLARDVEVDVRELAHIAHELVEESVDCSSLEVGALPLEGELLPDWYDDWVLIERERYRQLSLHALEMLARQLTAAGRFNAALEPALAAVAAEPLRESAHRTLIRLHLAEGNVAEARRQFAMCRRLLRDELGVEPSNELQKLVGEVMI
jgi:DNA-binding SARP family transcriptional activator